MIEEILEKKQQIHVKMMTDPRGRGISVDLLAIFSRVLLEVASENPNSKELAIEALKILKQIEDDFKSNS